LLKKIYFIFFFYTNAISSNQIELEKIFHFQYIIDNFYIEETKTTLDDTFNSILKKMDPHSSFLSKESFIQFKKQINGDFVGIGLISTYKDDNLKVISPIYNSPAYQAGIKPNDTIVSINNIDITGKDILFIEKITKGKANTNITLTINRMGEIFDKVITRKKININPISFEKITINNKKILFIKIHTFNNQTFREFEKITSNNEFDGIILDLRNNPGGLLTEPLKISNLFIPKGKVLLFEKSKKEIKQHISQNDIVYKDKPIVTIVNQGSASASEILAGILQDYNKSIIIGEKTFGKGSVQQLIPINVRGEILGAVKLTTSRYYLPSLKTIQNEGIIPNIYISNENILKENQGESKLENSLKSKKLIIDTKKIESILPPQIDNNINFEFKDPNIINLDKDLQFKTSLSIIKSLLFK